MRVARFYAAVTIALAVVIGVGILSWVLTRPPGGNFDAELRAVGRLSPNFTLAPQNSPNTSIPQGCNSRSTPARRPSIVGTSRVFLKENAEVIGFLGLHRSWGHRVSSISAPVVGSSSERPN